MQAVACPVGRSRGVAPSALAAGTGLFRRVLGQQLARNAADAGEGFCLIPPDGFVIFRIFVDIPYVELARVGQDVLDR